MKPDRVENRRTERAARRLSRSFNLPQTVTSDAIKATFGDGVLEINIPKVDEAKPRRIAISVNEQGREQEGIPRNKLPIFPSVSVRRI